MGSNDSADWRVSLFTLDYSGSVRITLDYGERLRRKRVSRNRMEFQTATICSLPQPWPKGSFEVQQAAWILGFMAISKCNINRNEVQQVQHFSWNDGTTAPFSPRRPGNVEM